MYDKGKIIIGVIIFLALLLSPFLYQLGKPVTAPTLVLGTKEKQCVESLAFMKSSHMVLLDTWRDEVVREGKSLYVNSAGKPYNMSLQNTCMKCHTTKTQFCDRCHDYLDVAPNCWDCHIAPKEKEQQVARSVK
ncbi:MAG: sulfate reduction electron transfer complex DsrMKJOP subunit DsrJ [Desulfomonilaceae bacterium]|nr:sulfate reduction electron transfer complex DsrMKJOP subunit DsrJ [Desulfomonilaceae bacterium]